MLTTSYAFASFLLPALLGLQAPGHGTREREPGVGGGPEAGPVWVERTAHVMGTTLRARVAAPTRESGFAAIESAFAEVHRLDSLLSTWRDDSEVAGLNRSPVGAAFRPSEELLGLLLEAESWAAATGGAFDPAVGSLVDAWDLRGAGRRPGAAELEQARRASGLGRFAIDGKAGVLRRLDGRAWLDTGAFGKGAALRAAREALRLAGVRSALLDFGGQVVAMGSEDERGDGWRVSAAHPARREAPAAELVLREESAATSGASERFVQVEGERLGHVLDPRTGRPSPPWGSVTVVADDPLTADVLSTALFVMGPDAGSKWLAGREGVRALFIVETAQGLEMRWVGPWGRTARVEERLGGRPATVPSDDRIGPANETE